MSAAHNRFQLPHVTTQQRLAIPNPGLSTVYDTDERAVFQHFPAEWYPGFAGGWVKVPRR